MVLHSPWWPTYLDSKKIQIDRPVWGLFPPSFVYQLSRSNDRIRGVAGNSDFSTTLLYGGEYCRTNPGQSLRKNGYIYMTIKRYANLWPVHRSSKEI